MQASAHLSQEALNHLTGNSVWGVVGQLYLALLKVAADYNDDTTTHEAKEVETPGINGYVRKAVDFDPWNIDQCISDALLSYGPSVTGWAKVNGLWLVDSATWQAGNIWLQGPPTRELTASANDSILYAQGEIIARLT